MKRLLVGIMLAVALCISAAQGDDATGDAALPDWLENAQEVASYQPLADAGLLPEGYEVIDDVLYRYHWLYKYPGQKQQEDFFIPEGVCGIERNAFGDAAFQTIYLPSSCVDIGYDELYHANVVCLPAAQAFVVSPDHPLFSSRDGLLLNKSGNMLLRYPTGRGEDAFAVPSGITAIGMYAFADSALRTVELPGSVTHLYEGCFYHCAALSDVTLSESLVYIGDSAFEGCCSLSSVSLPDSLLYVGSLAFAYSAIEQLVLPEHIRYIDDYAFYATGVEKLILPASLTYIAPTICHETPDQISTAFFYVYEGTYAHRWAISEGVPFAVLPNHQAR